MNQILKPVYFDNGGSNNSIFSFGKRSSNGKLLCETPTNQICTKKTNVCHCQSVVISISNLVNVWKCTKKHVKRLEKENVMMHGAFEIMRDLFNYCLVIQ